jgi:hypothetical protein
MPQIDRFVSDSMNRFATGTIVALAALLSLVAVGCGPTSPADPPGNLPADLVNNPNRPAGTVLLLITFNDSCHVTDQAMGYLYDNIPQLGGKFIDSQRVDPQNLWLYYYLPPETGRYNLIVKQEGEEIANINFYTSDRDLEFDPPLACK